MTAAQKTRQPAAVDEPAGRLLELIAETALPDPYIVSDKIAIRPLTLDDRVKLREIEMRRQAATLALSSAFNSGASMENMDAINQVIKDAEIDYDKAFFGPQHDAVKKFFANRPPHLWDAFRQDITRKFLPSPPTNGRCPHCANIIDLEQAGKALASST